MGATGSQQVRTSVGGHPVPRCCQLRVTHGQSSSYCISCLALSLLRSLASFSRTPLGTVMKFGSRTRGQVSCMQLLLSCVCPSRMQAWIAEDT